MIYLASPYTHTNPAVIQQRYEEARAFTAHYIRVGAAIFSPIVHCHELAIHHELPLDFRFWQTYNEALLRRAAALWVLQLEGWEKSRGVSHEISFAAKHGIQTFYKEPLWRE